ncbi:hypothetical protein NFI96_027530 [Prochilodus magdalenae]|nr:hypothetical protein NFI96_027530 [Prochilodus magdalenae]
MTWRSAVCFAVLLWSALGERKGTSWRTEETRESMGSTGTDGTGGPDRTEQHGEAGGNQETGGTGGTEQDGEAGGTGVTEGPGDTESPEHNEEDGGTNASGETEHTGGTGLTGGAGETGDTEQTGGIGGTGGTGGPEGSDRAGKTEKHGGSGWTGKLLVVPIDGSHWTGMKAVAEELGRRGHTVVVVMPEIRIRLDSGKHYITKTFPVPYGQKVLDDLQARNVEVMQITPPPLLERISTRISNLKKFAAYQRETSEALLFNQELMDFLREQEFDAVLCSPVVPTGAILAYNLSLPAVYMLRGLPCGMDATATACPDPPSYVPRFFTKSTDRMRWRERVVNMLVSVVEPVLCKVLYWSFEDVAARLMDRSVSLAEILSSGAMWLMRYDFTVEFPKPLMPNMVLIGGFNCAITNPLIPVSFTAIPNTTKTSQTKRYKKNAGLAQP